LLQDLVHHGLPPVFGVRHCRDGSRLHG
jgi:hypothetical protein